MDAYEQEQLAQEGRLIVLFYTEGSNQSYPYRVALNPDELKQLRALQGGQLTVEWYIRLTKASKAKTFTEWLKEQGWNRKETQPGEFEAFAEVLCDGSHEFHSCGKTCSECSCGFETLKECEQYELSKERERLSLR